ncbi:MAG TPA: A/G-specific adenine glycosylase [Usitatibacteraceae bacterium]
MSQFSTRITNWQRREGRHDLPWQNTRDPYRVWLSEIMLQQTQVAAVIPYYERFLQRFPDIATLAYADEDAVMQLWAGLGYYARARNLHKAARQIMACHDGKFPHGFDEVLALPGIGRSTAAAICAFSFGTRGAILDGNVKRVFARHFGVDGDIRSKPVEDKLWTLVQEMLPQKNIEAYTQGLMDLGASLCARREPGCLSCPVMSSCVAYQTGRIDELPGRGLKRETPHKETQMLVLIASGEVLLEKRPPTGIWGSLWSLPEVPVDIDGMQFAKAHFGVTAGKIKKCAPLEHGFTHYSLTIHPLEIAVSRRTPLAMQSTAMWLNLADALAAALPAPVRKILAEAGKR